MNMEKNKTFILDLPEVGKCYAIYLTKEDKDYILVKKEDVRLFKLCLNAKNETEDYENTIGLTKKRKQTIFEILESSNVKYVDIDFKPEDFFVEITPLKIPRIQMPYSLYLEEKDDFLTKNNWLGKTIQITSKFFEDEVIVFIYREKNILIYGIMANLEKVAKYVFKLENNILNLIKEERYNNYQRCNFLELKDEFRNLTTTSHEMLLDKSIKEENEIFAMKTFKEIFGIIDYNNS